MQVSHPPSRGPSRHVPMITVSSTSSTAPRCRRPKAIVPLVRDLVPARTVVDVGCGRGAWLRTFKAHGAETISGYDGAYVDPAKLLIPRDAFTAIDLSAPLAIIGRYDLAVCLEVGEHLPQRSARPLIQTLCQLAPAILFSAAVPGQGGTHHINEQWPHYWAHLFEERGFVRLDPIRRASSLIREWPPTTNRTRFSTWTAIWSQQRAPARRIPPRPDAGRHCISLNRLVPFYSVTGMLGELFRAIARSVRNRFGG